MRGCRKGETEVKEKRTKSERDATSVLPLDGLSSADTHALAALGGRGESVGLEVGAGGLTENVTGATEAGTGVLSLAAGSVVDGETGRAGVGTGGTDLPAAVELLTGLKEESLAVAAVVGADGGALVGVHDGGDTGDLVIPRVGRVDGDGLGDGGDGLGVGVTALGNGDGSAGVWVDEGSAFTAGAGTVSGDSVEGSGGSAGSDGLAGALASGGRGGTGVAHQLETLGTGGVGGAIVVETEEGAGGDGEVEEDETKAVGASSDAGALALAEGQGAVTIGLDDVLLERGGEALGGVAEAGEGSLVGARGVGAGGWVVVWVSTSLVVSLEELEESMAALDAGGEDVAGSGEEGSSEEDDGLCGNHCWIVWVVVKKVERY